MAALQRLTGYAGNATAVVRRALAGCAPGPAADDAPVIRRDDAMRYGFAVALASIAFVTTWLLEPVLDGVFLVVGLAAVASAGLLLGRGPAFLASGLFTLGAAARLGSAAFGEGLQRAETWRLASFALVAAAVSALAGAQRNARAASMRSAAESERGRALTAKLLRELTSSQEELRRNEEALRLAEDAAAMGAWDWNIRTGEIAWSRRCRELFGVGPDAVLTHDAFVSAVHPDDRARVDAALREALSRRADYDVELRVPSPEGSVRWVAAKGRVYCGADGPPERMVGMAWDVTDRKQVEQALREADRHKDEFLGVLSHELRNPLAPIRNSVVVLKHADPGGDQARRARAIIERQVDHLARLVEDLLELKRISAGKMRLRRERIDLVRCARETVEDLRPLFAHLGIALEFRAPPQPLWVDADATRLAQVVTNLLQNAAKFTDRNGRVSVSLERCDGGARLTVADDGAGIAPELLESLFNPFVQGVGTLHRSRTGLGLGLALVRGIVELHGGRASARSDGVGKGSAFEVMLPCAAPPRDARRAAKPAPRPVARRRVLVIDDSEDAAESLRAVLELEGGHEVEVAHDGLGGIEAARRFRPDVVLCDIGLPGLDGYEVVRRLRDDGATRAARMVALSGYASPEDVERALLAGFDYHAAKPADLESLLALVADAPDAGASASALPSAIVTGHHEVDSQHADILAALEEMRRGGPAGVWSWLEAIDAHTASHFAYEEALMDDVGYPHRQSHRADHQEFVAELLLLKSRIERDGATAENVSALVDATSEWVAEHVLRQDRRLAEFLSTRTSSGAGSPR